MSQYIVNLTIILAISLTVTMGFNNCAKVAFEQPIAKTEVSDGDSESLSDEILPGILEVDGKIVINGDDKYTRDSLVQLDLSSDGTEMYITNDPSCSTGGSWKDLQSNKSWQLGQKNQETKVYVMFRGSESNDSQCLSDAIFHDDISPKVSILSGPGAFINKKTARFLIEANDISGSGVKDILCTDLNGSDFAPCPSDFTLNISTEGNYSLNVKAIDKAGNESDQDSGSFVADWTSPTVSIVGAPRGEVGSGSAVIQIEASDAGSQVSRIECKVPNQNTIVNCSSGVVTVTGLPDGEQSFETRAIDNASNSSEWVKQTWSVDTSAPTVMITSHPKKNDNAVESVFEFSGQDGAKPVAGFECRIDGGAFEVCSSPKTYQLSEATYVFDVRSYDAAGNKSAIDTYSWTIDRTAPSVEWVSQVPDYVGTPIGPVVFIPTDNSSGIAGKYCTKDGISVSCDGNSIDLSDLTEGPHTIVVSVSDNAGNYSSPIEESFVYDTTKPTVEITKSPGKYTNESSSIFEFIGKDSDGSLLTRFVCKINEEPEMSCTSPVVYQLGEGDYKFSVTAIDNSGNRSAPDMREWTIDQTAPAISWSAVFPEVTNEPSMIAKFVATDEKSGVDTYHCTHNTNDIDCVTSQIDLLNLSNEAHSVTAYVVDRAGNKSAVIDASWTTDRENPSIKITEAPSDPTKDSVAVFEFEATDNHSTDMKFYCQVSENTDFELCDTGYSFEATADARNEFSVYAEDEAGNRSVTAKHSWYVDRSAPVLTWVEVPKTWIKQNSTALVFDVVNHYGSYTLQCSANGESVACDEKKIDLKDLLEGVHNVSVVAVDSAGNTSNTLAAEFNVDLTKPLVNITKGPELWTIDASATFEMSGADNLTPAANLKYVCQLNNGGYVDCASLHTYENLNEGELIFKVKAIDLAGHESDPRDYEWEIDRTGPEIVLLESPQDHGLGIEDFVHYRVTDPNPATLKVTCGLGGTLMECPSMANHALGTLPADQYVFTIVARDGLGNTSSRSHTWNVYDLTAPFSDTVTVTAGENKVDILFVVDNSGSMSAEQNELKNRIDGFISKISNLDYQIGVTSTDSRSYTRDEFGSTKNFSDGRLRELGTGGFVLKKTDSQQQTHLGNAVYMGDNGSSYERAINSTYRFLQRASDGPSNESQLLRPEADFFVIAISDEDECSSGCGSDKLSSQPSHLIQLASEKLGKNKKFQFNAIAWDPETSCSSGYNKAHVYKELVGLTGGIMGDVCANDYTSQLEDLGHSVVELVRSVELSCQPVHSSGVGTPQIDIVDSNGVGLSLSYSVSGSRLVFNTPLNPEVYTFNYHCLTGAAPNSMAAGGN